MSSFILIFSEESDTSLPLLHLPYDVPLTPYTATGKIMAFTTFHSGKLVMFCDVFSALTGTFEFKFVFNLEK